MTFMLTWLLHQQMKLQLYQQIKGAVELKVGVGWGGIKESLEDDPRPGHPATVAAKENIGRVYHKMTGDR